MLNLNFNWKDHFQYWSNLSIKPDIFKYEDLINNPFQSFYAILSKFINKIDDERFSFAVENSSFDSVKNYESKNKTEVRRWKSTNTKIPFFRSGKTDEWQTELDSSIIKIINNSFRDEMLKLNYL